MTQSVLPFSEPGTFYKGNLHTHCTASDGLLEAEEVVRRYRERGYDFIALSDHFLECYGYPVTNSTSLRSEEFTTLIAAELHVGKLLNDEMWHVLAVGLPLDFESKGDAEGIEALSRRALDSGAYLGIVHPQWYGLQPEDARLLPFAHAVEVYNHGSHVENERGDGWALCDILLAEGHRLHGFATDDAHLLTHDAFGGWIHVKAPSLSPDDLLQSLKDGKYYSSQGPIIEDIRIEGDYVTVNCSPASTVMIAGRGSRADKVFGEEMTHAALPLKRFRDGYFRITIVDAHGLRAWSNPIWLV